MGGISLMLLKGRERTSAFIAAILLFVFAGLTAGPPRHRIVDGHAVVEPVFLGRVVPDWAFFVVGILVVGIAWYGVHRLLGYLWPLPETIEVDKLYERPEGGFVAWKGDDPNAGSPLDYVAPRLRTALDYLQAEEPAPMRVLILGHEAAMEEDRAFGAELERWIKEATHEELEALVPAFERMDSWSEDTVWRVIEAHEVRGVPTLSELSALADSLKVEALRDYVAEKGTEGF